MLRDYQENMCRRIGDALDEQRSVMVQMPTGTGKTVVLASLVQQFFIQRQEGMVLIVAHRRELLAQIETTLKKVFQKFAVDTAVQPGQGGRWAKRVAVSSVQWLRRHIAELGYQPELVIIDEAHHAVAESYKMLWQAWPKARFLGMTATPYRLNGKGFGDLFDVLLCSLSVPEFVRKNVLSTFDYFSVKAGSRMEGLVASLKKRGRDGDFQAKEMNDVLNRDVPIRLLTDSYRRYAGGKKGIVYAVGIDHARRIAHSYQELGVRAAAIDARTPGVERDKMIDGFRRSELDVLVNVDIFSEGFDCPDVEFIQLARPTLSLAKYLQMVGRGLRRHRGKKCCVIIDNVGLYRRFGLPTRNWDWNAFFRGREKDEKLKNTVEWHERVASDKMLAVDDFEMGLVVGHEELERWMEREFAEEQEARRLNYKVETKSNGNGGVRKRVVDSQGEDLTGWQKNLVITSDGFARYGEGGHRTIYVDLVSRVPYDTAKSGKRPVVTKKGWMELVTFNLDVYTRHKWVVVTSVQAEKEVVGDCIIILGRRFPNYSRWELFTRYCFRRYDDSLYTLEGRYCDGQLFVRDEKGEYWLIDTVNGSRRKLDFNDENERDAWQAGMARKTERRRKQAKHQAFIDREAAVQGMTPYECLKKWGIMCGGNVIIPAQFRRVKKPVGKFFAFEKFAMQWGVMDIHGNLVVEPRYRDVSITSDGKALVTLSKDVVKEVGLSETSKWPIKL